MQSRIFQISARLFLLAALAMQIAFGAGTIAYCISSEKDSRIHVCSSPSLCEKESQQACATSSEDQLPTSCCEEPSGSSEPTGCSEELRKECVKHYCSTTHSCNLVPNHLTSQRQTEIQFSHHHSSIIRQADYIALPSVILRAIRGDSSPPRQIAELTTVVPRRGPPILS